MGLGVSCLYKKQKFQQMQVVKKIKVHKVHFHNLLHVYTVTELGSNKSWYSFFKGLSPEFYIVPSLFFISDLLP